MRILTSILCLALGGEALAADMYRWKDKDGVTHYSDQPTPGAEKVPMSAAPMPGSVAPVTPARAPSAPPAPFAYAGCEISSPSNDQVFNAVSTVSVSVGVQPALQTGHRLSVQVNGQPASGWPPGSSSYVLQNLARGSYSVMATISDENGRTLCTSENAVTFHIRQPSLLTPGRQAAPR